MEGELLDKANVFFYYNLYGHLAATNSAQALEALLRNAFPDSTFGSIELAPMTWNRYARYALREAEHEVGFSGRKEIRPFLYRASDRVVTYCPGRDYPQLFHAFCDTAKDSAGVLKFVNSYGLLDEYPDERNPDYIHSSLEPWGGDVQWILRTADKMRAAAERIRLLQTRLERLEHIPADQRTGERIRSIEGIAKVVAAADISGIYCDIRLEQQQEDLSSLKIVLRPDTLLAWMWLTFVQEVVNTKIPRVCVNPNCKRKFSVDPHDGRTAKRMHCGKQKCSKWAQRARDAQKQKELKPSKKKRAKAR
jgi:hypothetical protein